MEIVYLSQVYTIVTISETYWSPMNVEQYQMLAKFRRKSGSISKYILEINIVWLLVRDGNSIEFP